MAKKYTADTFEGALTGTASGNVSRTGDTGMTGNYATTGYIYTGQGLRVGGTGTANELDDYEEGTFTPILTDGTNNCTIGQAYGRYTKIGNIVNVYIEMDGINKGAATGICSVSNMPFTANTTSFSYDCGSMLTRYIPISGFWNCYMQHGTTTLRMTESLNGGNNSQLTASTDLTNTNAEINVNITYKTL